jgi:hypothetical protein
MSWRDYPSTAEGPDLATCRRCGRVFDAVLLQRQPICRACRDVDAEARGPSPPAEQPREEDAGKAAVSDSDRVLAWTKRALLSVYRARDEEGLRWGLRQVIKALATRPGRRDR